MLMSHCLFFSSSFSWCVKRIILIVLVCVKSMKMLTGVLCLFLAVVYAVEAQAPYGKLIEDSNEPFSLIDSKSKNKSWKIHQTNRKKPVPAFLKNVRHQMLYLVYPFSFKFKFVAFLIFHEKNFSFKGVGKLR